MSRPALPPISQNYLHTNLLSTLVSCVQNLFGGFEPLFEELGEPRQKGKIQYTGSQICWIAVILFLERLAARDQIHLAVRDSETAQNNISLLLNMNKLPHGDTVEYVFKKLRPGEVQACVTGLPLRLLERGQIPNVLLPDGSVRVVIDGVEMFHSSKPLFEGCMRRNLRDKELEYYAKALECKLIGENGLNLSLQTEFIENVDIDAIKQDSELKAFERLADKISLLCTNQRFTLIMDAMFASQGVMRLCQNKGWNYIITLKDKDLKRVVGEFESKRSKNCRRIDDSAGAEGLRRHRIYEWVENIEYQNDIKLTVVRMTETSAGNKRKFQYITNMNIKQISPEILIENGRHRWKIENEGFNIQKNQDYKLEHAYSKHLIAYKNYYLILQLAHGLLQMMEACSQLDKQLRARIKTQRNFVKWIAEGLRNFCLSESILLEWNKINVQFTFPPKHINTQSNPP